MKHLYFFILAMPLCLWASFSPAADFNVGPGQSYPAIGAVGLVDVILLLQVAAGLFPERLESNADIGGDQKIGLEEALYGLAETVGSSAQ